MYKLIKVFNRLNNINDITKRLSGKIQLCLSWSLAWNQNKINVTNFDKEKEKPVFRQSGEKSIGSESVMMSFQGWN